ncbi:hypothetical protein LOD99_1021 [Oopsacas minuta]|uniref:RNA ligase domain-containing protein n=1 Tax=Oopsacas minuta TaxID=111878 RepID=A0AAV7K2Y5_9METZ|nr:hypothetical protein LOD99_1021 [Oopsacas minuta]
MAEANPETKVQKYPRTPHFPFSPGVNADDIMLPSSTKHTFLSQEAILTEKLDGGNCSIFRGKVFARTVGEQATHPSFGAIKQLAAQISCLIPDNIQIFCENLFAIHSIQYDGLDSYVYIFAVLENGKRWLSWDEVVEWSDTLGVPTVPMVQRGIFGTQTIVEEIINKKMKQQSAVSTTTPEGFVLRCTGGFNYNELDKYCAKYVRAGHIQTDEKWKKTWKQAKLTAK